MADSQENDNNKPEEEDPPPAKRSITSDRWLLAGSLSSGVFSGAALSLGLHAFNSKLTVTNSLTAAFSALAGLSFLVTAYAFYRNHKDHPSSDSADFLRGCFGMVIFSLAAALTTTIMLSIGAPPSASSQMHI